MCRGGNASSTPTKSPKPMFKIKVDFHLHSNYSDGENSLSDIFNIIEDEDIKYFAITDHNCIHADADNFISMKKKRRACCFQGIEISTYCPERKLPIHILGFSSSFNIERINNSLVQTIEGYNNRAEKIIKKLNFAYPCMNMNFNQLLNETRSPFISRNLIANRLSNFIFETKRKKIAFKEVLKQVFVEEGEPLWMMKPQEAIEIVTACGGVAVFAHPGKLCQQIIKDEAWFRGLCKCGLRGIEALYPSHTYNEKELLIRIAGKYNLCVTAGSDWHGYDYTPLRKPGILVDSRLLRNFFDLILKKGCEQGRIPK